MLMGDIFMRRQTRLMHVSVQEAVDLNPDYLDKKTRSFRERR